MGRGLLLQIDAPDLALERHTLFADRPLGDFLAWVELVVGAINDALEGIDPARVRLHVCWGNYEGPHTLDVPLEDILPLLYRANVGALVVSMANPRHAHEYRCFDTPPPARRHGPGGRGDRHHHQLRRAPRGRRRPPRERGATPWGTPDGVIAGTDCGFDTSAGIGDIAASVVWAKLRALRAGADLATTRLWSGAGSAGGRGA